MKFTYQPKWKEELVGSYGEHKFIVELTMGKLGVYFPEEAKWESAAPAWAKGKWSEARDETIAWCEAQRIPFVIDQAAWVSFS